MTNPLEEILLQWCGILLVTSGLLGVVLSLFLFAMPDRIREWNERLDRYFEVDKPLSVLDASLPTDPWIYRHTMASGSLLLLGSVVLALFLYARLDDAAFASVFLGGPEMSPLQEIVYRAVVVLLKIASLAGAVVGVCLLFAADKIRLFDLRMTHVLSTEPVIQRLNRSYRIVDRFLLRHPRLFGSVGLVASTLLTWVTARYLMHS